jgi:glycolate oxidase iron-sulfur subunit
MTVPAIQTLTDALASKQDLLSHCVHCGFCLPACPTYQVLGDEADSPRGRLHLMRAVVEGRLDPAVPAFQEHIDRCLGCRACEPVCPSGVEYGTLLEHAREVAVAARPAPWLTRVLLGLMAAPVLLRIFGATGRLLRVTGIPGLLARILPERGPLAPARLGLAMLASSAPVRLGKLSPATVDTPNTPNSPNPPTRRSSRTRLGRAALLQGCIQNELFRRVHDATRVVLEVQGWEVMPIQASGCCGALHAHAGSLEEARALARKQIETFRQSPVDFVVMNAAGCGAHLRGLAELLGPEAHDLASKVRDVSELLAGEGREPVSGGAVNLRVAMDPPCHLLHAQRVSDPPVRMLRAIPGLTLVPLRDADRCCGGAGVYGITHPELGGEIGGDKVAAILETDAQVVATGNPGCHMQIGAGLRLAGRPLPVVHPVELLAESYRRAGLTTLQENG